MPMAEISKVGIFYVYLEFMDSKKKEKLRAEHGVSKDYPVNNGYFGTKSNSSDNSIRHVVSDEVQLLPYGKNTV